MASKGVETVIIHNSKTLLEESMIKFSNCFNYVFLGCYVARKLKLKIKFVHMKNSRR